MLARMFSRLKWNQVTREIPRIVRDEKFPSYYGQYHQDRFVADLFQHKRGGFFVDIGANDGISFSNTCYFEKALGWSGIAFEPHPVVFKKLAAARSCATVNAGVGPDNAILKFSCVDAGAAMLSGFTDTFNRSHRSRVQRELRKFGAEMKEIDVPTVRLEDSLRQQNHCEIDYLSLDTEGGELEILKSIDFANIFVGCLSIENNTHGLEIYHLMSDQGFRLSAIAGCDEIYVNRKLILERRTLNHSHVA
jgi:FkbM family methyltransferase